MLDIGMLKELDLETLNKRKGDRDADVRRIQEWINLQKHTNYSFQITIAVDGFFGPATLKAVKEFQWHNQLEIDGVVGHKTWTSLTEPLRRAFHEFMLG